MNIRRAIPGDVGAVMDLIRRRMGWMDEKGLDHWNKEDYFDIFPELYFRENIDSFLVAEQEGRPMGAMALFDHDAAWGDKSTAWYVHHLVAEQAFPGTGGALLRFAENMALAQGISRIRLDSYLKDHALSEYYEKRAYRARGLTLQGHYIGVRREKYLDRENPPYDAGGVFDFSHLQTEGLRLELEKTTPGNPEGGWPPAYHFILRHPKGEKMGSCQLRVGHSESLYYSGHIGYQVEEAFRGEHLAARAVKLLFGLAEKHGLGYVLICCRPDNEASCRTARELGCRLLEEATMPSWHPLGKEGVERVLIYGKNLGEE